MCSGAGKCLRHLLGSVGLAPLSACPAPVVVQPPCGRRSCPWHGQIPSSPCCPSRWRSAPPLWPRRARPSYPRGQRCGSLQGRTRDPQKCPRLWLCLQEVAPGPERPRVLAALPGPAPGGHGEPPRLGAEALPAGARPSLVLGLLKARGGESVRVKRGYRCQETPHQLWRRPVPLLPAAGS